METKLYPMFILLLFGKSISDLSEASSNFTLYTSIDIFLILNHL